MIYRNGIYYDRMIRNGVVYDRMIRNGIVYGDSEPPSPESFRAVQKSTNPSPYGFYEYLPADYDQQNSMPLLIFFHGSDERGDGNGELYKVLKWGIPKQQDAGTWHHNFITLSPQWLGATDDGYYDANAVRDFIQYAKDTYKVATDQIYLTGVSAGGWIITYFLEQFPTSHGIAASVPISCVLENGYTTAAGVAASGCPMWWLSNIGDPLVPWNNTYPIPPNYLTVVDSVAGINAIRPGLVEKLTGFNNTTHDGTWDGIYDSSLIGTANPGFDPFDEPIYDWLLEHTYVPAGRVFNVGTGSGEDLEVNGADTGAPWYPLQDNDTFVIQAGTYGYVLFTNFLLASGKVNVTCAATVTLTGYGFYLSGANKNLDCDFNGNLICNGFDNAVTIDENSVGDYDNIRVAGIKITGLRDGGRMLVHNAPEYNNGAGPIASRNVVIDNWEITLPAGKPVDGLSLGGYMWTNAVYATRNLNPVIKNIVIRGQFECQYPVTLYNAESGIISDVDIQEVNTLVTGNLHCRLTYIVGQGTIERVVAKNHMGNAACIWGFYRIGNDPVSVVRNIVAQNSNRYSAVEIQGNASYNVSGVGANTDYFIGGVTADTLDTEKLFSGCAADVYATHGGAVTVRDVVSINGHSVADSGTATEFNAIRDMSDTVVDLQPANIADNTYADRTAAGVDINLIPQPGSPLIGNGVAHPLLSTDFNETVRPDPPSVGAYEPA